jgi:predicted ATPase
LRYFCSPHHQDSAVARRFAGATGDPCAAERNYHQALAVARRQSAKLFELRASISLARLWCKQGKRSEAWDLVASCYNWFTEGFDACDLKEAKALLEEVAQQGRA